MCYDWRDRVTRLIRWPCCTQRQSYPTDPCIIMTIAYPISEIDLDLVCVFVSMRLISRYCGELHRVSGEFDDIPLLIHQLRRHHVSRLVNRYRCVDCITSSNASKVLIRMQPLKQFDWVLYDFINYTQCFSINNLNDIWCIYSMLLLHIVTFCTILPVFE